MLSNLFDEGPWTSHAWDLKMNLLDVCRMPDEEILSYNSELRTVFGFMKYARDRDKLKEFINNNPKHFNSVSETALNALDELTHSPELREIRKSKYQKGEVNMSSAIREMIEEGRMEGRMEGDMKARRETAYELFDRDMSLETISEIIKVSIGTVEEWLAERSAVVR